jgi:hypothetical protein
MKKKETHRSILWFFTSGIWLLVFCKNLLNDRFDWIVVIQLFNSILSFANGILNTINYRREKDEDNRYAL